jgi:surfeit locus 1 family protein
MSRFPGWLRYGFPAICFGLGTWQVYRLDRKTELIHSLEQGLSKTAIKLYSIPSDLESYRYRRLKLHGSPEPGSPIFLGPRGARDIDVDFAMSFVIPFRMVDGTRVLVDYGRVPLGKESEIKIPEEQYVEVMLDRPEKKSFAVDENVPELGKWLYRDVEAMGKHCKCQPIAFKRITQREEGIIPIAGPPKIEISNRHLEYIATWYLMSAASFALGFMKR